MHTISIKYAQDKISQSSLKYSFVYQSWLFSGNKKVHVEITISESTGIIISVEFTFHNLQHQLNFLTKNNLGH